MSVFLAKYDKLLVWPVFWSFQLRCFVFLISSDKLYTEGTFFLSDVFFWLLSDLGELSLRLFVFFTCLKYTFSLISMHGAKADFWASLRKIVPSNISPLVVLRVTNFLMLLFDLTLFAFELA